jgi:hypothetical protein
MRRNHSNVNTVIGVLRRLLSRPTFIERLIRQVLQIGHVWKNLKNELTQTSTPTLILKNRNDTTLQKLLQLSPFQQN